MPRSLRLLGDGVLHALHNALLDGRFLDDLLQQREQLIWLGPGDLDHSLLRLARHSNKGMFRDLLTVSGQPLHLPGTFLGERKAQQSLGGGISRQSQARVLYEKLDRVQCTAGQAVGGGQRNTAAGSN